MTEAKELNEMMRTTRVTEEEQRRRDGDFFHGQVVGAAYVLDRIGAPAMDGHGTLTVGQRLERYLAARAATNTEPPA